MAYPQPKPQLGATFTPGGLDDFYLPEVISPAPQRCVHLDFLLSPFDIPKLDVLWWPGTGG